MFAELPDGFHARPPVEDDAQAIADVMNALSAWFGDEPQADAASVRDGWSYPGFERGADDLVITDAAGSIVGYEWTCRTNDPTVFELDGFVHPAMSGRGVGTYLIRWAEARAAEVTSDLTGDTHVTLRAGSFAADVGARELLSESGFQLARHFWRMEIQLDEPPPALSVPECLTIRTFVPGQDERATYETVEESFLDHWGHIGRTFEQWRTRLDLDDFDPSLWFLAVDGEQLAGVTLCRVRGANGWVNTVGVRRPWRRRGLATALLLTAFHAFFRRGIHVVSLGVDAQSPTGATRVYEQAGMTVRMRYDLYEKVAPRADLARSESQHVSAGV